MSMLTARGGPGYGRSRRRSRRGPRRRRRLPLLAALLLLAVLAGGAAWWELRRPEPRVAAAPACPPPPAPAPAPTPAPAEAVTVNIYNATDRQGLAAAVAKELRGRGFRVRAVANDPLKRKVGGVGEIRHGRQGVPAATAVALQVESARMAPDARAGRSVDLVLGAGYQHLRAPEEAAAGAAPTPEPSPPPPPPGC